MNHIWILKLDEAGSGKYIDFKISPSQLPFHNEFIPVEKNKYIYICIIYIHICSYNSKHATSPPLPGFSLQPHFPSTQQKFDRMPEVIHPSPSLRWYLITLRLADFLRFLLYRACFGDHKTLKISINSVPSHLLRVSLIKMGRGNLLQLLSTINMSTCQSTSSGWKLEMHIWFFEWIFNSLGFKIGPKMGKNKT